MVSGNVPPRVSGNNTARSPPRKAIAPNTSRGRKSNVNLRSGTNGANKALQQKSLSNLGSNYDESENIFTRNVQVYSLCPHHLIELRWVAFPL